jgi:hypothetical protein
LLGRILGLFFIFVSVYQLVKRSFETLKSGKEAQKARKAELFRKGSILTLLEAPVEGLVGCEEVELIEQTGVYDEVKLSCVSPVPLSPAALPFSLFICSLSTLLHDFSLL